MTTVLFQAVIADTFIAFLVVAKQHHILSMSPTSFKLLLLFFFLCLLSYVPENVLVLREASNSGCCKMLFLSCGQFTEPLLIESLRQPSHSEWLQGNIRGTWSPASVYISKQTEQLVVSSTSSAILTFLKILFLI